MIVIIPLRHDVKHLHVLLYHNILYRVRRKLTRHMAIKKYKPCVIFSSKTCEYFINCIILQYYARTPRVRIK